MKLHKITLQAGRVCFDLYTQKNTCENYSEGANLKQYLIAIVGDDVVMASGWEDLRLFMKDYPDDLRGLIEAEGLERFMVFLISVTSLRRPITDHELWAELDPRLPAPRAEMAPRLESYGLRWYSTNFQTLTKHEWHFATGEHFHSEEQFVSPLTEHDHGH